MLFHHPQTLMAEERQLLSKRKRKGPALCTGQVKQPRLEVTATGPSLTLMPDNIVLWILSLLDVPSLMNIARVNRRFYQLHSDEYVWRDVDLSTLSKLNVKRLKDIISKKLHPSLWRLSIQSNAVECQANSKMRPIINSVTMDELFKKCPQMRIIKLVNIDLTKLSKECLLWVSHLEQITFSRCIVPFKWMDIFRPCWPNLKHLYLPNTSKTSDQDLQDLASLKDIHKFQLSYLSLQNCYRVGKAGIQALCTSFPGLLLLDISHCHTITHECLFLVAEHLTSLKKLSMEHSVTMDSTRSADDFLSKLQKNCCQLKLLTVSPAQLWFESESEHILLRIKHLSFDIKLV